MSTNRIGEMAKLSHKAVNYEHPAKYKDKHCGACRHFISDGPHCQIVRDPIRAEDWCEKFSRKGVANV